MRKFSSVLLILISLLNICLPKVIFAENEVTVRAVTENTGNIFPDSEDVVFNISVDGATDNCKAEFLAVYDDTEEIMWSAASDIGEQMSVTIPVTKNGGYHFYVSVKDDAGTVVGEYETVFSKIMSGDRNPAYQLQGHFGIYKDTIEEQMLLIDMANAGGYRDHPVGWQEYEDAQDNGKEMPDNAYFKRVVEANEKLGFESSLNSPHLGARQYTGDYTVPPTEADDIEAWAEYAYDLLQTGGVKRAEIWNEPNLNGNMTTSAYVNIVKAGVDTLNKLNTEIEVGAVSLANPHAGCMDDVAECTDTSAEHYAKYGKCYFNDLVEEGLLQLDIDAITLHPYSINVFSVAETAEYYRKLLDDMGKSNIKLWITEYGWYTGTEENAVSEEEQAEILVKEYLLTMSENLAEHMSAYNLTNKYDVLNGLHSPDNAQHNFGLLEAQTDATSETGVAFSAKKSYIAIAAMNALVANATGTGMITGYSEKGINGCGFTHKDGDDLIALWSGLPQTVELVSSADSLDIYDFYGNCETVYPKEGKFIIETGSNVSYIKGDIGEYSINPLSCEISNEEDLKMFRDLVNNGATKIDVSLTNDIVVSGNWIPIAAEGYFDTGGNRIAYCGSFDGNGHSITINTLSGWYNGLFGRINGTIIKNLTINGNISGGAYIGGFAGQTTGACSFENCANYANITITGDATVAQGRGGGFVGDTALTRYAEFVNCYNAGNISSTAEVYGFTKWAKISNCYNYGTVTATSGTSYPLILYGTTENSYFLEQSASSENKGTVKNAEQFQSGEVAYLLGDAFGQTLGADEFPVFSEYDNYVYENAEGDGYVNGLNVSSVRIADGYAEILSPSSQSGILMISQYSSGQLEQLEQYNVTTSDRKQYKVYFTKKADYYGNCYFADIETEDNGSESTQGDGTEQSPYIISTYEDLVSFREKVNNGTQMDACAKLTTDIDLSAEENWTPIGTGNGDTGVNSYKGIFDGNGYEIKNMRIITGEFYKGLFGYTDNAVIQNLKVSGEVKAGARSAGFVGCALDTTIKNCANNVDVTCTDVGASGFIGFNQNTSKTASKVENSYSLGNINGTGEVVGIMLWGTVTNCYAYGDIVGSGNAFRLSAGTVTNSYYKSCTPVSGGGGTQKSADAFASGEVAYLLGDAFGQTIGTDEYPVFIAANNKVVFKTIDKYKAFFWDALTTIRPLGESITE